MGSDAMQLLRMVPADFRAGFWPYISGIDTAGDLSAADAAAMLHAALTKAGGQNIGGLIGQRAACDNDNINADGQQRLGGGIGRADDALCAVALDGIADLFACGDAEAVIGQMIRAHIEQRAAQRAERAGAVKPLKIGVLIEFLRKKHGSHSELLEIVKKDHNILWPSYLRIGSVGQLCTTLCTAASQNLATVCGCHTLPEAVLHLAVPLLRLICSLHGIVTPFLSYLMYHRAFRQKTAGKREGNHVRQTHINIECPARSDYTRFPPKSSPFYGICKV